MGTLGSRCPHIRNHKPSGHVGDVVVLLALLNLGNVVHQRPLEPTTAAALLVTFALGCASRAAVTFVS
jgi:uncharacterized membrane protein (DUF4010 family)